MGQEPMCLLLKLAEPTFAVLLTGAGQRPAKLALSKIAWGESGTLEYCISSGLAGGLRPEYSIAQVMAAREIASEAVRDDNGRVPR